MKVAIVRYNAGNVSSVIHAMERLGTEYVLTDDREILQTADRVIFPGVGEASGTMRYLRHTGLDNVIRNLKQPVLGICLGQQLMCASSQEGDTDCLGIFNVPVLRFKPGSAEDKIPHMGWNDIHINDRKMFGDIPDGQFVYFVHSYYVPVCEWAAATTDYILPFSAALHKDNFYATQFHPEKSGAAGERILETFLTL